MKNTTLVLMNKHFKFLIEFDDPNSQTFIILFSKQVLGLKLSV